MAEPGTPKSRRRGPAGPAFSGWALLAAVLPAASGCATVDDTLPPPVAYRPAWDTGARALAGDLGLRVRENPALGTFVLEGEPGRVVFVDGTRTATVAGERMELGAGVRIEHGDLPLLESDAVRISTAWNRAKVRWESRRRELEEAAAPPPPPPASPTVPSDPEWRVPLRREWRGILIHHSATESGNLAEFDRYHREVNGWLMVGYDFIITNGVGAPDGLVETSDRWRRQIQGAHAGPGLKEYNEHWIGICLVGDFNRGRPTARQLASLRRLIAYLQQRCGIPDGNVRFHRDVRDTECPGGNFPVAEVRRAVRGL